MALALVNTVSVADYGSGATSIATAATSLTGGNLAVVFVRNNNGQTVSSITDTASNTYTLAISSRVNSGGNIGVNLEVWYAKNVTGNGSNITTVNYSASVAGRAACVLQYSGASTTAPYNGAAGVVHSSSVSVTSNPYTSNVATGVVILFCNIDDQSGSWTTPSGFTSEVASTNNVLIVFDKIVSATQTVVSTAVTHSNGSAKDLLVGVFTADAPAPSTGGGAWGYA